MHLQVLAFGSRIAHTNNRYSVTRRWLDMLGELTNIPTDTLIDMLFVILDSGVELYSSDLAEIEQIQHELRRRGEGAPCGIRHVN